MKIKRLLFLFSLPLLLAACTSYKNVPYLQNPEAVNDLEGKRPLEIVHRLRVLEVGHVLVRRTRRQQKGQRE